ncbi:MAG: twin-arginine translocase subunit TatC [bacterium]
MTESERDFDLDNNDESDERRLSFVEHLEELRSRIIYCLISLLVTTIVAFFFSERLLDILFYPGKISIQSFYFTSLLTPFNIRLKVAFWTGIIVSCPLILYQLWRFIAPALKRKEKNVIKFIFWFALWFFLAGVLMAYFWILPLGIPFLLGYATPNMKPIITVDEYISLTMVLLVAMGIVFETPLVLIGLNKIGLITAAQLSKNRRYAFLISVLLACAITPGSEFWTSLFLIIPLYLLYELSIWLIMLIGKR